MNSILEGYGFLGKLNSLVLLIAIGAVQMTAYQVGDLAYEVVILLKFQSYLQLPLTKEILLSNAFGR